MFKESREEYNRIQKKIDNEYIRTYAGDGSFTFNGYDGRYTIKNNGDNTVSLTVYYPLKNFSWLNRSGVERSLGNFLRGQLSQYRIRNITVYD